MKKVIGFIALAAIGIYALSSGKDKGTQTTNNNPSETNESVDSIIAKYNGKIVIDGKGYWMVIQNGKVRAAGDADLPLFDQVNTSYNFWETAAATRPEIFIA